MTQSVFWKMWYDFLAAVRAHLRFLVMMSVCFSHSSPALGSRCTIGKEFDLTNLGVSHKSAQ